MPRSSKSIFWPIGWLAAMLVVFTANAQNVTGSNYRSGYRFQRCGGSRGARYC